MKYKITKLKLTLLILCLISLSPVVFAKVNQSELLKAADKKAGGEYVRSHYLSIMKKPFENNDKKKLLIVGDSHAQDFLNTITENSYLKNYQISTRYIPVRCQMFMDKTAIKNIAAKDRSFCAKSDTLAKARQQIAEADVVILVSDWKSWAAKLITNTIKHLELKPQQKLYVVGSKSFGSVNVRKYLRMPGEKLLKLRNEAKQDHLKSNAILRQTLPKDVFIDIHQQICGDSSDCPVFTQQGELISFDGGHLTKAGARYVGRLLFKNTALARL